jgi:hypothetical protein
MTTAEFDTCLVPVGPISPAPVKGFIMASAALYEWGFGLPLHRFLCSLLRSYGLELHHLSPSGILHAATFMTPCEANLGVDPPLNLWSHFFRVWLWPDSGAGAAYLGSVNISVHTSPGSEPYFLVPQPSPLVGWQKA